MISVKSIFLTLAIAPLAILAQNTPQTCDDSYSMTFDPAKLAGIWFEVARNPAPPTAELCTQLNLTLTNDNVYDIATTYGDAPSFAWVNATMIASVSLGNADNPYGYNFTYAMGFQTLPLTTYKLLDTDYANYALICGYQDNTENITYFNILLTRERMPSDKDLISFEDAASQKFAGFSNSSMTKITQTIYCYTYGGASTSAPFIYGLVLALLLCLYNNL